MEKLFCDKCNAILPKGRIVCSRCGYENPELLPVLCAQIKHKKIIRRAAFITAAVGLVVILHIISAAVARAGSGKQTRNVRIRT